MELGDSSLAPIGGGDGAFFWRWSPIKPCILHRTQRQIALNMSGIQRK